MKLENFTGSKQTILFHRRLFQEHLEEASFLYEQRKGLLHDPEMTWLDIRAFEDRLIGHLQALVKGGEDARDYCLEVVDYDEAGELFVAASLFCLQQEWAPIISFTSKLNPNDDNGLDAVRDAFKHFWPNRWNDQVRPLFDQHPDTSILLLPTVIGFQRLPYEQVLTKSISDCPEEHLYLLIWSLGRLQVRTVNSALFSFLENKDVMIKAAASLALLRSGQKVTHYKLSSGVRFNFSDLLQMMLSGSSKDVVTLIGQLENSDQSDNISLTLGVLGDVQAVPVLLRLLDNETTAESAAVGLNLITGADLYEEVFVPDEIDPDELLDDELEKLNSGEPLYALGEEPGANIVRLSMDAEVWQSWWLQNSKRFRPGVRYRAGRSFSPMCLIDNLRNEKMPFFLRQIAYEELVARYGINVHFEADMMVKDQMTAIEEMSSLVAQSGRRWIDGQWYFAGSLLD